MYFKLKSPLKMSAIAKIPFSISAIRHQLRIAIIDDNEFPYTSALRTHTFNVTELGDIHDFAAVAEYPIVACDIKGVGSHFGVAHQGAHVIAEIHKLYPGKYLIAYSGGTFGPPYKKYWDCCDVFLRRDGGFEQWVDALDLGIKTLGDPVQHWRRMRRILHDADTSAFEVYLLEEAYIKSILQKDVFHIEKAMKRVKQTTAAGEVLDNVASGLITAVKLFTHAMA